MAVTEDHASDRSQPAGVHEPLGLTNRGVPVRLVVREQVDAVPAREVRHRPGVVVGKRQRLLHEQVHAPRRRRPDRRQVVANGRHHARALRPHGVEHRREVAVVERRVEAVLRGQPVEERPVGLVDPHDLEIRVRRGSPREQPLDVPVDEADHRDPQPIGRRVGDGGVVRLGRRCAVASRRHGRDYGDERGGAGEAEHARSLMDSPVNGTSAPVFRLMSES